MKNWKEIEGEFDRGFEPKAVFGEKSGDFQAIHYINESIELAHIKAFFKFQFKEIMEEMVGEEFVAGDNEMMRGFKIYRQEMLDKIKEFFGEDNESIIHEKFGRAIKRLGE